MSEKHCTDNAVMVMRFHKIAGTADKIELGEQVPVCLDCVIDALETALDKAKEQKEEQNARQNN